MSLQYISTENFIYILNLKVWLAQWFTNVNQNVIQCHSEIRLLLISRATILVVKAATPASCICSRQVGKGRRRCRTLTLVLMFPWQELSLMTTPTSKEYCKIQYFNFLAYIIEDTGKGIKWHSLQHLPQICL